MTLSKEQLEELEKLSGACMKVAEIALILQLDEEALKVQLNCIDSPIRLAYQKGFLMTKFKVNKKIIDLADAGSSPAQSMSMKLIQDIELENVN